jgi:hypothetical protein
VFLTALIDRNSKRKGRKLCADDYVTKPIDFDVPAYCSGFSTLRRRRQSSSPKHEPVGEKRWRRPVHLSFDHTHCASCGASGERCVGLQRRRNLATTFCRFPGVSLPGQHRLSASRQNGFINEQAYGAWGNINFDAVAFLNQSDQTTFCDFG